MSEVILSSELLEALPDAIVAVDRAGTIVQVNSQAQELFGYERDELVGQKVEMLVPESYRPQHHQHRETFTAAPKTRRMGANLDLYGRRRNGSQFPVEISLSPVYTKHGTLVLSAIRDISDRKRIAEELRRANEELHRRTAEQLGEYRSKLALIIDSSEDAIISKDLNGIITSWNKGSERIYGYTPEEIVGKHISLLAPSDRPNEIPEILRKIAGGENIEHYESQSSAGSPGFHSGDRWELKEICAFRQFPPAYNRRFAPLLLQLSDDTIQIFADDCVFGGNR